MATQALDAPSMHAPLPLHPNIPLGALKSNHGLLHSHPTCQHPTLMALRSAPKLTALLGASQRWVSKRKEGCFHLKHFLAMRIIIWAFCGLREQRVASIKHCHVSSCFNGQELNQLFTQALLNLNPTLLAATGGTRVRKTGATWSQCTFRASIPSTSQSFRNR